MSRSSTDRRQARTRATILALVLLGGPGLPVVAQRACGVPCGTERWAVKTLTDADAGRLVWEHPVPATVTALRALTRAPGQALPPNGRVVPVETTLWDVHAVLLGWKREPGDSDFHLVIAEPAHHRLTLIAEIPSGACAGVCRSPAVKLMRAARAAVVRALGRPSAVYRRLRVARPVHLVGVGFFDFIHGQTGVAPNGLELHPVVFLEFDP